MKKVSLLAAMVFSVAVASSAYAAGYGAAGCGLGGMLLKENKKLHQVAAWILNGVSGNQTFAMTSGTSECGPAGLVLAESEQNVFVESNYDSLTKEMAVGEGEHLTTLAGLLGCPASNVGSFGTFAQQNFGSIIESEETTPTQMLAALKKELSSDQQFAATCQRI